MNSQLIVFSVKGKAQTKDPLLYKYIIEVNDKLGLFKVYEIVHLFTRLPTPTQLITDSSSQWGSFSTKKY